MPIYEYRCDRCGVFEVTQRITEPALSDCPTCNGAVARLISATSFQLKGSGWYVTDYARKGLQESKDGAKSSESTGGPASSSSTDSSSPGEKSASSATTSTTS